MRQHGCNHAGARRLAACARLLQGGRQPVHPLGNRHILRQKPAEFRQCTLPPGRTEESRRNTRHTAAHTGMPRGHLFRTALMPKATNGAGKPPKPTGWQGSRTTGNSSPKAPSRWRSSDCSGTAPQKRSRSCGRHSTMSKLRTMRNSCSPRSKTPPTHSMPRGRPTALTAR